METSGKYLRAAKKPRRLMSSRRSRWVGGGAMPKGTAGTPGWGDGEIRWTGLVKTDGGLLLLKGFVNPRNQEP